MMALFEWLGQRGPQAAKHKQLVHAWTAVILHYVVVAFFTIAMDELISWCMDTTELQPHHSRYNRREVALGVWAYAVFIFVFRLTVVSAHQRQHPKHFAAVGIVYCWNFLCNVTLIVGALGAWNDRYTRITQAYAISVGIDQLLWGFDLFLGLLTGFFPVGVSKYLFRNTSWVEWVTPFHHIWTIPVLFHGIQWAPIDFSAYCLSVLVISANVIMSRWLTPATIQYYEKEEGQDKKGQREIYLNVNLSHELWQDIKIEVLQVVNKYKNDTAMYIIALLWRWSALNFVVFCVLQWMCIQAQSNG